MEGAFFGFGEHLVFPWAFKDLRNVVAVFGHAPGVDKNVINVDEDKLIEILQESSQVTFIYIALLTIQIVTKHCTISK